MAYVEAAARRARWVWLDWAIRRSAVAVDAMSSQVFWSLAAGRSGTVSTPFADMNCSTAGSSAAGSEPVEVEEHMDETSGAEAVREDT